MMQPPSVRLAEWGAGVLGKILPAALMRLAYRAGYVVLSTWWSITRPALSGAKVVVTRGDEVLFVRLTYGARDRWDLPGGTARAGEPPLATAARELAEEVGLSGELELIGEWTVGERGRQATLHCYRLEVALGTEPAIDAIEIAEARWFARANLPARLAKGTDAIVNSVT